MNLRFGLAVLATLALGTLSACVVAPPREEPAAMPPPPPPIPQLYVYPNNGQSPDQLDRDRYECNNWSVKQTGFDPSQPQLPPHERVQIVAGPPPGVNTVGGAITGDAGKGAAAGAAMGGVVGGFRRRDQRMRQADKQADTAAATSPGRSAYMRAMSACLQGRGYTVN